MKIIGQIRTSFNSTRRIVRINNTNSKDNTVNSTNRDLKQKSVRGQGSRKVNISFDIMNKRKLASERGSIDKEPLAPGYSKGGKEGIARPNLTGNSGAFRRGGRARGGGLKSRNNGRPMSAFRGRGGKRFQNNKASTTTASLVSYISRVFCKIPVCVHPLT